MTTTTIPLQGLSRHTPDATCGDGEMAILHNMRLRNGALRPIHAPTPLLETEHTIVAIHTHGEYKNWIAYHDSTLYFEACQSSDGQIVCQPVAIATIEQPIKVESVANTLVIITQEGVYYALFDGEEYQYIGLLDPKATLKVKTEVQVGALNGVLTTQGVEVEAEDTHTAALAEITKLMAECRESGLLLFPVVLRYAFRLYDGSYTHHSSPLFVAPRLGYNRAIATKVIKPEVYYLPLTHYTLELEYKPYKLMVQLEVEGSIPTDIVKSVDLFIQPLEAIDIESEMTMDDYDLPLNYYNTATLVEQIVGEEYCYKVGEMAIADSGDSFTPIELGDRLLYLEHQPYLPIDNFSHHHLSAAASFVYNAKLHLGGITTIPTGGHGFENFLLHDERLNGVSVTQLLEVEDAFISTYLKTTSGTLVVESPHYSGTLTDLNPLLSYPDARAYKMELYYKTTAAEQYRLQTLDLTASSTANYAYYLAESLAPIMLSRFYPTVTALTPLSGNNCEYEPNKLKVSATNNPFAFPVEQTYTVSGERIVAMASATQALSQGQFGAFPLYVFTTEGIWALQVGSSDVAYLSATPIGREVCTHTDSITPLDSAVAFTSSRAINLIEGSTITSISDPLWGTPLLNHLLQELEIEQPSLEVLLQQARIGYNYNLKEVWVSCSEVECCFVYSLDSHSWSSRSALIEGFINDYPSLYFQHEGVVYATDSESEVSEDTILLLSRPIKLGSLSYKKPVYTILQGHFIAEGIAYQLWASNDGIHYTPIAQASGEEVQLEQLLLRTQGQGYRYFIFSLTLEGVGAETLISHLEIAFNHAYNNKLR